MRSRVIVFASGRWKSLIPSHFPHHPFSSRTRIPPIFATKQSHRSRNVEFFENVEQNSGPRMSSARRKQRPKRLPRRLKVENVQKTQFAHEKVNVNTPGPRTARLAENKTKGPRPPAVKILLEKAPFSRAKRQTTFSCFKKPQKTPCFPLWSLGKNSAIRGFHARNKPFSKSRSIAKRKLCLQCAALRLASSP
jgi:hypothetical protein